jgi:hypothetical protein
MVVRFELDGKVKMLPVNVVELLVGPFTFLPLVDTVLASNCLARVEAEWT